MYGDFDTKYVSAFGLLPEVWIGILIFIASIALLMIVSLWRIFKKAEKPGWISLIPIYNLVILLQIANMPAWQVILFFIPIVNFYVLIMLPLNLAKVFHVSSNFGLGLMLLPMVFYPVLAFNKKSYIGINKDAAISMSIDPNAQMTEKDTISTASENIPNIQVPIGMGNSQMSYQTTASVESEKIVEEVEPAESKQATFADFKISSEALLGRSKVEKFENVNQEPVFFGELPKEEIVEKKEEIPSFMESFATLTPVEEKKEYSSSIPSLPEIPPISPKVSPSSSISNSEYVICPKCNATMKKGSPRCFLCGTLLK